MARLPIKTPPPTGSRFDIIRGPFHIFVHHSLVDPNHNNNNNKSLLLTSNLPIASTSVLYFQNEQSLRDHCQLVKSELINQCKKCSINHLINTIITQNENDKSTEQIVQEVIDIHNELTDIIIAREELNHNYSSE